MNDFTKEELEEILAKIDDWYSGIEHLMPDNPLISKIQSMIENYCEHEKCPHCNLNPHPANVDCIKLGLNHE